MSSGAGVGWKIEASVAQEDGNGHAGDEHQGGADARSDVHGGDERLVGGVQQVARVSREVPARCRGTAEAVAGAGQRVSRQVRGGVSGDAGSVDGRAEGSDEGDPQGATELCAGLRDGRRGTGARAVRC